MRGFRKSHHAVAYVAGRENLQLFSQPPAASAIVRDSDNRCERFEPRSASVAVAYEPLQSCEQSRKTRAAANGYELQAITRLGRMHPGFYSPLIVGLD